MKRFAAIALGFLFISGMQTSHPLPPAIEVSIRPSTMDRYMLLERQTPLTYTCHAWVMHPSEKIAYAKATVVVGPGNREKKTEKSGPYDVTFTVAIGKSRERARAEVTVSRNGELVTKQISEVTLMTVTPSLSSSSPPTPR